MRRPKPPLQRADTYRPSSRSLYLGASGILGVDISSERRCCARTRPGWGVAGVGEVYRRVVGMLAEMEGKGTRAGIGAAV